MGFLASFAYLKDGSAFLDFMTEVHSKGVPTMLDSGAFTLAKAKSSTINASKQLKTLTVDTYIDFCKKYHNNFTQYVQLDKLRDKASSRAWLQKMYDAGLSPMPVFTVDDDESTFHEFLAYNKKICVAGNPTQKRNTWVLNNSSSYKEAKRAYEARFERFWRASNGEAKLHGLSFTRGISAWRHHCYSVDSSTWVNGSKFGELMMFDPFRGTSFKPWKKFLKPNFIKGLTPREQSYLVRSGVKLSDLAKPESTSGNLSLISILSIDAWISYCLHAKSHGCTYYFAIANLEGVSSIGLAAKHRLKTGGVDIKSALDEVKLVKELAAKKDKSDFLKWLVPCFEVLKDEERYKA